MLSLMTIILIGVGAALALGFVLLIANLLGIPTKTRRGFEKRQAIARQIHERQVAAEAARNLEVREAEARLSQNG